MHLLSLRTYQSTLLHNKKASCIECEGENFTANVVLTNVSDLIEHKKKKERKKDEENLIWFYLVCDDGADRVD